jgi:hypothetical protein
MGRTPRGNTLSFRFNLLFRSSVSAFETIDRRCPLEAAPP